MTTGMKAIICLRVSRSNKAANSTTNVCQSQSPKSAGLSIVHFLQMCFHMTASLLHVSQMEIASPVPDERGRQIRLYLVMRGNRSHGSDDQGNTVDRRSCIGVVLRLGLPRLRAGCRLQGNMPVNRSLRSAWWVLLSLGAKSEQ